MILASESYMRLNLASCAMARAREALTYNGIDDLDVRLERHAREFETAMSWMRHGVVSMAEASHKASLAKSLGWADGWRDAQRVYKSVEAQLR